MHKLTEMYMQLKHLSLLTLNSALLIALLLVLPILTGGNMLIYQDQTFLIAAFILLTNLYPFLKSTVGAETNF